MCWACAEQGPGALLGAEGLFVRILLSISELRGHPARIKSSGVRQIAEAWAPATAPGSRTVIT